jgi:prolyl-tRNA editing enzyme YbaK/EbsC (Cys-tRNA(Pro) deacylase)
MAHSPSTEHNKVLEALAGLDIEFEVMPCAAELADTEVFCAHYNIPLNCSANTIVVAGKAAERRYAACVLLADSWLDTNKVVRKKMEVRRISFASAEETIALTGMIIGGVTPLSLPATLPLWVDERVMDSPYIVLGGGDRETKLKISPRLFHLLANVEIVPGMAKLRE